MKLLKDVILGGLSLSGLPRDQASILMYHSVSEGADYFMNVEPKDFERQMKYLADSKRPVISLAELIRRMNAGESLGASIVLTFDDGYRDNYEIAFPILKQYQFPATIFVTTDMIGKSDKRGLNRLTIDQIKEMHASGLVDIEPHTKTHPRLAQIAAAAAAVEIGDSKQVLESLLGKECKYFAYPYGSFNNETDAVVRECGFVASSTVGEGTVTRNTDPYKLPRNSIDQSTSMAQFRGKISRAIDIYTVLKKII